MRLIYAGRVNATAGLSMTSSPGSARESRVPWAALGLCLILPFALVGQASPDPRTTLLGLPAANAPPTSRPPDWAHLADALPLLGQAEPAEVETLAYQVTMAAASANCGARTEAVADSRDEADLLAKRIYSRLACSPAPLQLSHLSWRKMVLREPTGEAPAAWRSLPDVDAAIERGARVTGVSPAYLRSTAIAESGLRASINSKTSSAQGLYQFLDNTWLATVCEYGPRLGLTRAAAAIEIDASGRARVTDPAARAAILALRSDPLVSSAVAGMLTRENATRLAASGLVSIDAESLYAAHVLGAHGAAAMFNHLARRPQDGAAKLFAAAAGSNLGLFYAGGRTRSFPELVQVFRRKIGG